MVMEILITTLIMVTIRKMPDFETGTQPVHG